MISDPWFYGVAVPAMVLLGMSKGGLGVVGMLVVPLMAIVIPPMQAAGIVLPILILSDFVALYSYRGTYDRTTLKLMMPGALIGVLIGWLSAAWISDDFIRLIVGVVAVLFAANYWLSGTANRAPRKQGFARASFWGVVSGFTSFVSHAGGPPFQMYVAPLRLNPAVFAGTMVVMFTVINAAKLVPFFFLGQFDATNLTTSAFLLPISIPATIVGVWVVKRFEKEAFYGVIYGVMFAVGLYLAGGELVSLFA